MCENHSEQNNGNCKDHWEGEDKHRLLINQMLNGYALHEIICNDQGQPIDYRFLEVNSAFEDLTGLKSEFVVGRTVLEILPQTETSWIEKYGKVVLTGEPIHFEDFSRQINRYFDVIAYRPAPNQFACFFVDITERKQAELYRNLSAKVLAVLNESANFKNSIQKILAAVKRTTGCDALGMRLQIGEDFPYFIQNGFPDDFLLTENTLVERAPNGDVCRNPDGTICLECTCGLVISGKIDPSNQLFTKGGSFWTNDALPLLDIPAEDDPRHNPRNQCIHKDYASVALMPIRAKDRIVGLLQINGHQKGLFTLATIHALEGIASNIGETLMRKKTEDALRESKALLDATGRMAKVGGWELDAKTKEVTWTEETYRIHELPLASKPPLAEAIDFFHPEDRPLLEQALRKALDEGRPYDLELRFTSAKGRELLTRTMCTPILENGKVVRLRGTFKDITDRKRAEVKIKESEACLRDAQRIANIGNWLLDLQTGAVELSDEMLNIIGFKDKNEASNVLAHEKFYTPESWRKFNEALETARNTGKSYEIELEFSDKNPKFRNAVARGEAVYDENNKIIGLKGTLQDITKHKQAELALTAEKERLSVTLRSIGDGVISTDDMGNITMLNKAAEVLTGWNSDEATGRPASEIINTINEHTRQQCENLVEKVLATGEIVELANHTCLVAKDGREIVIANSGAPICDNKSRIIGVVLVFRDMTEKLQLESSIRKTQKLESIGLLAGGIAHDFNNILTGIFTNLLLAKESISKDHSAFELLERSEETMDRAARLTNQLLTFAKGGNPVRESICLGHLVKETALFDLSGSNVKPIFEIPKDLWMANVDKGQIQQVFSNIIINANQAMPNGGCLYISVENAGVMDEAIPVLSGGEYVKVSIRDEGTGIDDKSINRIFDPYFTTKQTGSGLGLATAYSIINKHDGCMNANSELGKGTTFTLYLPACESERNQKTKQPELEVDPEKRKSARVLVMDDEEIILTTVELILKRCGYFVTTATDGEEAVKIYKQSLDEENPYDALIMDLTIPGGVGGKETIGELLKINPKVKCIVSSGYANDPIMANYSEYGFKGIIAKPYTPGKLRNVLGEILKESA